MAEPSIFPVGDSVTGRQIPWSEEAEISVLSAMLIDGDAVARAIEMVGDSSFYREANRRVFRAMVRLYSRGEVIDVVTLSDELKSAGELEGAGGMVYLARLVDAVPTAANIEYHCRILRDKAVLRQLIESATDIVREAYEAPAGEVEDTLDRAEQRIFQIAQSTQRQGFVWIKEILWPTFERIEELQNSPGSVTGVASGFPDLDNMTAGFQKGDLIIVAGRPSMGKTALAMNFAQHAAIDKEVPVAVFSLEMSKESLVQRLLCSEGRVDAGRLRRGRLQDDEYARLATAAGHLNTAPIWIDDTPAITALELRAKARRLASEVDLGLIIVDYLQLDERSEQRGQPAAGDQRHLQVHQGGGQGAQRSRRGALAALPCARAADRQATRPGRSARVGSHRAGRGPGAVRVPGRGLSKSPRISWTMRASRSRERPS